MYGPLDLSATGRTLVATDVSDGSDAELRAAALGLADLSSKLDLAQARVLAELERRGVCDRDFGMTTSGWLAREAHLPPGRHGTVVPGPGLHRHHVDSLHDRH